MVYSFRIISGIMKTKDVEPMDALDKARREIDTVDAALAALFERRMAAVLAEKWRQKGLFHHHHSM